MYHLTDLDSMTEEDFFDIIRTATDILKSPMVYSGACRGKILATLFYEPSTRTCMSFQSAMLRLGGGIIGFDDPSVSSVTKGETLKDTIKVVSGYSDIVVIRHYYEGAAKAGSLFSNCPVINAGDGGHLHPTQTLSDLLTLSIEKKTLKNLTVGFCGDLFNGRTVHSLVKFLVKYPGNRFIFISSEKLSIPLYIKELLKTYNTTFSEARELSPEIISQLDVLYMTRLQRERFDDAPQYETEKGKFILTASLMKYAAENLSVLHPLPRNEEISSEVDIDPRALYFKQAQYGMYVRMALILKILGDSSFYKAPSILLGELQPDIHCTNKKCVSFNENYLPKSFIRKADEYICEYCERGQCGAK